MDTAPAPKVPQQLWDDALSRILNLSKATLMRNVYLENRLDELETELGMWKRAHSDLVESSKRESQTYQAHLVSLNREISLQESVKNQNFLVLCIIDGDRTLFSGPLIAQGRHGGRHAAQLLTVEISRFLSGGEDIKMLTGQLSFWVTIYLNKTGLASAFVDRGISTQEQFDSFWVGFSQTSPRFSVVDVGEGPEATSGKIREVIQTFIRFPQTLRIFFAGYHHTLNLTGLRDDPPNKKVVVLKSADDELHSPTQPVLNIEGLFMKRMPSPNGQPYSMPTCNGIISPNPILGRARVIDPSFPLHKQDPPPCNEHYLMSCPKGDACKYSHDYVLTDEQLATLASNAKKAPCNWLKTGLPCPHGDRCCWGHVCPSGSKCFHLSKGKCWFKGENMHSDLAIQDGLFT